MEILIVNIFSIIVQALANCYMIEFMYHKLFNCKTTKFQKYYIYFAIFFNTIICTLLKNFIPGFNTILSILIETLLIYFILKIKLLKSLLMSTSILLLFAITEIISVYLTMFLFHTSMEDLLSSPLKLFSVNFLQIILISSLFFLYFKIRRIKPLNFGFLNSANNKQTLIIIALIVVYVFPQMLIFIMNSYSYPVPLLAINSIQFVLIFIFAFKFIKNILDFERTQSELFTSELHNKTLVGMVDGVRTLKHDYGNIIQSLNGYIVTKEYDKLEEHVNSLLKECNAVDDLSMINPEIFNNPAIYGIVGSKYFLADKKNIPFHIKVSTDVASICFSKPKLSRILGILLDNAIEASQKSKKPSIFLKIYYDKRKCADMIQIANSYDTKININLVDIFKKGYSTKEIKSGIGLWEVKKLIDNTSNSQIYASIENNKFIQTILIEKNEDYILERDF